MLACLTVPYVDVRASALGWWLGEEVPTPLACLVLLGSAGSLELRLLGASHHVVATTGSSRCPEVVACGSGDSTLPARHDGAVGAARYRFRSTVTAYDAVGLSRVAADLRRRWTTADDALVGVFPGSPDALTVLHGRALSGSTRLIGGKARGGGWSWSSWHVYPESGEVVRTRSRLVA